MPAISAAERSSSPVRRKVKRLFRSGREVTLAVVRGGRGEAEAAPVGARDVGGRGGVARVGGSCVTPTGRRSGRRALALHPEVRPGLPAPAARRVSRGPSGGE